MHTFTLLSRKIKCHLFHCACKNTVSSVVEWDAHFQISKSRCCSWAVPLCQCASHMIASLKIMYRESQERACCFVPIWDGPCVSHLGQNEILKNWGRETKEKSVVGWKGNGFLCLALGLWAWVCVNTHRNNHLCSLEVQPQQVTSWITLMLSDISYHLEESGFGSDIKPIMDEDYFDYCQWLWTIVSQQNNCEEIHKRSGRTDSWRNTKSSFLLFFFVFFFFFFFFGFVFCFFFHLHLFCLCLSAKKYILNFSSWMNEGLFDFFKRTFESRQIINRKAKHNLLEP